MLWIFWNTRNIDKNPPITHAVEEGYSTAICGTSLNFPEVDGGYINEEDEHFSPSCLKCKKKLKHKSYYL